MRRIVIVGAGASGMAAAITAARLGCAVTLLEAMEKPGKKLLLTGSGKCNLTNRHVSPACYPGGGSFAEGILRQFSPLETLSFFRGIGLLATERNGGMYPVTGQASSVLDVLLLELARQKVRLKCREKVLAIEKQGDGFSVRTAGWAYQADAVILSAGSMAAPQTGSDGSGYQLAASLGHRIQKPLPALVPLKVKEGWAKALAGIRMPAAVTLRCQESGGRAFASHTQAGELQWTDYGISGIAVFQVSRHAVRALDEGRRVLADCDLLPLLSEGKLLEHLQKRQDLFWGRPAYWLSGILPHKAIAPVLSQANGASPGEIAAQIKHCRLTICGAKDFARAQVCQGGVDCAQFCEKTLESRFVPGFYCTGELLDVDGICGGYNLQWAWSSGFAAGRAAALGTGQAM